MKIFISPDVSVDTDEVKEDFVRSSGPGGQNVNKVSTSVRLHFDAQHSLSLTDRIRSRLRVLAGRRMSREGVLTICAGRYRTQERNRVDAMTRFVELVREATREPTLRKKTRPTKGSVEKRLNSKIRHSRAKRERRIIKDQNE